MNIEKNKYVSLVYELHTDSHDGPFVEKCDDASPLGFVYGAGRMLPAFEEKIANLKADDEFSFTLTPDEGYGPRFPEAVVDVPKNIFVGPDGKLREELLVLGSQVPMLNDEGNRVIGTVLSVSDDAVTLDFNHKLAGEVLCFSGKVIEVRDATVDELLDEPHHGCGGGCGGCHGGCHGGDDEDGCNCGDEEDGCHCGEGHGGEGHGGGCHGGEGHGGGCHGGEGHGGGCHGGEGHGGGCHGGNGHGGRH